MTTLVLSVDREGGLTDDPVVGWEAVRALVTDVGIDDPEDSRVNCLLETLKVARDLRDENEEALVAVVSGRGDAVASDRAVARSIDDLVANHDIDSAIIVVGSAEGERLIPIIESRIQVDAVDRVVVRQSHDIESTYYVLKQFLADEELRSTLLIPLGAMLVAFPVLYFLAKSIAVTVAVVVAVLGVFFLYKGLGIDDLVADLPRAVRDAFYSGQVSLVTYVIGIGLALVGVFAGAIGVSSLDGVGGFLLAMRFIFDAVPWLAAAALAASTGRLLDELLDDEGVRSALLNLPFGVVAVGLVVRGFAAYFLERGNVIEPLTIPSLSVGALSVSQFTLSIWERLAVFVVTGVILSLVGVQFASYVSGREGDTLVENP